MSYAIEYNRQFIKTKNGYIPCWLVGDNNVTTGHGRTERRVRDWSIFLNWVDVSEEYMLEHIKELFNSYNQHWKKGSNWISNEGLIRWVKSGCKYAATLEEVLEFNRLRSVECKIVYYMSDDKRQEISERIKTNDELEKWIEKVKSMKQNEGVRYLYPIIDFYMEDLKTPIHKEYNQDGKYFVKNKHGYLVDMSERTSNWTKDIRQAKAFNYSEIEEMKQKFAGTHMGSILMGSNLVDASKFNGVTYRIKFVSGVYSGRYIYRRLKNKIEFTIYPENAKEYSNKKAAEKALKELNEMARRYGELEIEEVK